MADPVGPLYAAGISPITKSGYTINFLPDAHNYELQAEGKAPVYYYLPNEVRLARRNGDTGDYIFSMIHFVGVRGDSTHVGVPGKEEVTGGLLGFSTTSAPPGNLMKEAQQQIIDMYRGNSNRWWGWRNNVQPVFRPVPVVSNTTTVTNLSPNPDGSVPVVTPPGAPAASRGLPPAIQSASGVVSRKAPRSVPRDGELRASNLDPWYVHMQGQGPGSVTPEAHNAYSGLMGSLPAALVWTSFHGGTGGFSVWQNLKLRVVSPVITLDIVGDWDRIQDHFSAAAHGGGWFWSADIKAAFNNMRQDGTITVNCFVDTTLPDAAKLTEQIEKRSDLVFQKFMEQAQKVIFDPPAFNEEPAKASGGFLGLGGGAAFKLRRDKTHLHLEYHEKREIAYFQDFPISGQLQGLYDEIKADPANEKKYFTTLYLSDWERKVSRTVVPIVNWPDAARKWVGQPCAMLSAQIGYPNTAGVVQWDGHLFQRTDDPAKANWSTAVEMKSAADVQNAPAGWTPDKTFVKRKVHFTEPPSPLENPNVRVDIEKNVVDLDPGELGTLTNEINLEVRVDEVGGLAVGPIGLNVDLETPKQFVEVTFQAQGKKADGTERAPVKFSWAYGDQYEPRFWMLFTGQPDFMPRFKYQVKVIVKGSIFTKGMEWTGPWQDSAASGPLMVTVPTPEDEGVTTKSLVARSEMPALPVAANRPSLPANPELPVSEANGVEADGNGWHSPSAAPSADAPVAAEAEESVFESYSPAGA
ncbi:hypothetical protein SAMN05421504_107182 [Amycolatopsis xylanica]|uniref:Uncharacterized protein n=1 Tax=Amycolatopsis xylanica TaxID=589385 RepID=A0A1H3N8Q6_9PSEU|nr:hypothetical protein [Amycolatopsis xylanica]SDY85226.1 hypothetical protein SAMN05421504_107182 [Amycolatopsis xylanica]